ncbi:MAG: 4'-phosphopantetheinyl transferase superfamily protein [Planctomycetota bacterium]
MSQITFGEIHLWWIDLCKPASYVDDLQVCLSKDELAKAEKYVTEELRRRYIITRGTLRHLLAGRLGCSAKELQFGYQALGKPHLRMPANQNKPIEFNVSHSGDVAMIALGQVPIGVDVELHKDRIRYQSLVPQIVSEREAEAWSQVAAPERDAALLQIWVCKEALLKAMGLGIAEGIKNMAMPLPIPAEAFHPSWISPALQLHLEEDANCRCNNWLDTQAWQVQLLESPSRSYAALTTLGCPSRVVVHGQEDPIVIFS